MSSQGPRLTLGRVVVVALLLMIVVYLVYGAFAPKDKTTSKPVSTIAPPTVVAANVVYSYGAPTWVVDFTTMSSDSNLDTSIWNFEEGNQVASYNEEAQTYTSRPQNVRIENGVLVIQALPESLNDREYTSARINTKGKMDFLYGRLEIVAKMPRGVGAWGAIWLRSTDQSNYQQASDSVKKEPFAWALNGEIDIAESQGAHANQIFVTAHSKDSLTKGGNPNGFHYEVADMYDTFHTYGMEWTPTSIIFTFDGAPVHTITKTVDSISAWPYDHTYHLVINLAIGGDWAVTASEGHELDFKDGIDPSTPEGWILEVKSISYSPLIIPE